MRGSGSGVIESASSGTYFMDDDDAALDITAYNLTDREQRGTFTHRIVELCQAAGPVTVRREVLPMLHQLMQYEDAAALVAQAIPDVVANGGGMKHVAAFVPLVEAVVGNVDPMVASEGVDSVRVLIDRDDADEGDNVMQSVIPMIVRMATSKWYGARCASAQLLADAYRVATDGKLKASLRELYSALCQDVVDAVRKAAVASLSRWCSAVPLHEFQSFVFPFVVSFAKEQYLDGIRIDLVGQIVDICRLVPQQEVEAKLLPLVTTLVADRSWRVRFIVAKHIGSFVSSCSSRAPQLVPSVIKLASDEETEVRSVTASQLEVICSSLTTALVEQHFVDVAIALAKDDAQVVKAAIALTICQVSHCCTKQVATERLLPAIIQLLHDKAERVRCNLLEHIPALATMLDSKEVLAMLVGELVQAIRSPRWRVREAVAIALRQFLLHLTAKSFEPLLPTLETLLVDDVHAVRTATIGTITVVSQHFGSAWSAAALLSFHKSFAASDKFDRRCIFLACLQGLLPRIEPQDVSQELLRDVRASIEAMTRDPVANVRRTLGKTLLNLQLARTPLLSSERDDALLKLRGDTDSEVQKASQPKATEEPF